MPEDPYSDPVTGVLHNKLGLTTSGELETAEREITHAALIFLKAIMRGDPTLMRKMLDELIREP
jgi:fido (protein-threonine AMPylation protein)